MSANMTAFFVERTGHVLGAVTRAAGAGQVSRKGPIQEDVLVEISGLDGPGGSAHVISMEFLVSGKELSTLVVDPLPELLLQPLSFHAPKEVDAQGIEQRPKEVKQLPERTLSSISVTATEITVTLRSLSAKLTNVWIMVAGGALKEPLILAGNVPKDKDKTNFQIPKLGPGTYRFLVLVEECLPLAGGQSFP